VNTSSSVPGVLDHRERAAEQGGREHDIGRIVVGQGRGGAQRGGNAPAPHVLHRARIGGLGTRLRPGAQALLDQHHGDAARAELDRKRQPDWSGADDQHLRRFGVRLHPPAIPPDLIWINAVDMDGDRRKMSK
jgi:hypothetical protein